MRKSFYLLLLIAACHRGAAREPAHAVGQFGAASVTGRVVFHGTAPQPPGSSELGFPDCARFVGGPRDPG